MQGAGDFAGTRRFQIRRRLGEGGMGVVYDAYDVERQTAVALKTLRSPSPQAILRFKREFRALQHIQHRNLVQLGELIEDQGAWFFTMELIDGVGLLAHLRRAPDAWQLAAHLAPPAGETSSTFDLRAPTAITEPSPGVPVAVAPGFDERRLRDAIGQLARGLLALHAAGKVHRDVKPSNVMVDHDGRVVLLDFGLITEMDQAASGWTDGHVVGTAGYMAPEQALGTPVGPEADWYGLGALLYEALVGTPPFKGTNVQVLMAKQRQRPPAPRTLVPGVPVDLDRLCMGLLEIDPTRRPSGAAVLRHLGQSASGKRAVPMVAASNTFSPPFVGRDEELAELRAALAEAGKGKQTTVLIYGESGIGKSALLRRFCEQAIEHDGAVVLGGRCHERETVPYKALDAVIDALARYMGRLPRAEVALLVPRRASLLAQVFPVLRHVAAFSEARQEVADPLELRTRVFAALRELLGRLAERKRLIIAIGDVQWADADGLALLAELIAPPDPPAFLLVASWRAAGEEARDVLRRLDRFAGAARHLRLERLGDSAARELARALLLRDSPDGHVDEATVALIAAEAHGHPFFIDELARESTLARREGHEGAGPVRLEDVLWSRIQRLDDAARRALEVVMVAAAPIDQDSAAQAAGMSTADFGRQVALLRVGHLVRTSGPRGSDKVEPFHDLVRETVSARLSPERARELHRLLARALELSDGAPVESLARHHLAAGDRALAADNLEAAAGKALEKLAFDRAAALYGAALEIGDHEGRARGLLLRQRAYAHALAGDSAEAAQGFRAAAEATQGPERLELFRLAADNLLRSGQVQEGLVTLRESMSAMGVHVARSRRGALLGLGLRRMKLAVRGLRVRERDEHELSPGDLARVDSLFAAATTLGMIDRVRGSDIQTRHLLLALRLGEERRVTRALAVEALFRASTGGRRRVGAAALAAQAEERAQRHGDAYLNGIVRIVVAGVAYFDSRLAEACQGLVEAERIFRCECAGAEWERVNCEFMLALARCHLGNWRELAEQVERGLEQAERRHNVYAHTIFSAQPNVWRCLVVDDPGRAEVAAREALEHWPKDDYFLTQIYLELALAMTMLYRDQDEDAATLLEGIRTRMRQNLSQMVTTVHADHLRYSAVAALRLHDDARAAARARELERVELRYAPGFARYVRAVLAARAHDRVLAQRLALEAVQIFDASEFHAQAQAARHQLGCFLANREGRRLVEGALAWFHERGVVATDRMIPLLAPELVEPDPPTVRA